MRFIMFMIPGVYQSDGSRKIGADFTPSADDVAKIMKYNEELAKAGVLISLDGFHPPVAGARIRFPSPGLQSLFN